MMAYLVEYTRAMLLDGAKIAGTVDRELALTLRLFSQGGEAALAGRRGAGVRRTGEAAIGGQGNEGDVAGARARRQGNDAAGGWGTSGMTLAQAYAFCRGGCEAGGEELLLFVSRAAKGEERCHVRGVCVYAQGG